ncbi:MAG: hypothetical protein H7A35_05665 [Planctomycetales bacterium]|nr:hypothetical protein [bacterium]UNM09546.1 MAG: hypothetical protein H7A35_05665 [Planctomycetales bacterium]
MNADKHVASAMLADSSNPGLLTDARELFALMRGQAHNPLLEQWQLARQRKWQRSGWWARYGIILICWLPSLALYYFFASFPFSNPPDPENFAVPLMLGGGPLVLLIGLLLPLRLATMRTLLMLIGGLLGFAASFSGFRLYSTDVEDAMVALSFAVLIPLFSYTLAGLFAALGHGLDITSETGEARRDQSAQDIRLSLLGDREVLLAYLALHLPQLFRRIAWLGWGVMMVLVLSTTSDFYNANLVLPPAMLGAAVWVSSQLAACVMLMLAALSIRLQGSSGRSRLSVLLLFIGAQYGLALASCFVMFEPGREADSYCNNLNLGEKLLLLSPLLLSVPLSIALRRAADSAADLLALLGMLLSASIVLVVLLPDLQYLSDGYVASHQPEFMLSLLLPVMLLSGLWLARYRAWVRTILLVMPALLGALSLVILLALMFSMSGGSLPVLMQELVRSVAAYSVGSVLAVQSSIFWGDWNSLHEPLIEWWRWPLHVALQFVVIFVMYRLALQQVRAWRMNQ